MKARSWNTVQMPNTFWWMTSRWVPNRCGPYQIPLQELLQEQKLKKMKHRLSMTKKRTPSTFITHISWWCLHKKNLKRNQLWHWIMMHHSLVWGRWFIRMEKIRSIWLIVSLIIMCYRRSLIQINQNWLRINWVKQVQKEQKVEISKGKLLRLSEIRPTSWLEMSSS